MSFIYLFPDVVATSEWLVNQHRDSMASYIGHPNINSFLAIVENESSARVRFNLLEVRISIPFPCFLSPVPY